MPNVAMAALAQTIPLKESMMPNRRKLTSEGLDRVAGKFKALADPTRLAIIHALMEGEKSVSAVVEATGASQPNVSRHLGVLLKAGLIGRRKAWPHSMYSIVDPSVTAMCEAMCASAQRDQVAIYEE